MAGESQFEWQRIMVAKFVYTDNFLAEAFIM